MIQSSWSASGIIFYFYLFFNLILKIIHPNKYLKSNAFGHAGRCGETKTGYHDTCIGVTKCTTLEQTGGVCQRIFYVSSLSRHSHQRDSKVLSHHHTGVPRSDLSKLYLFIQTWMKMNFI